MQDTFIQENDKGISSAYAKSVDLSKVDDDIDCVVDSQTSDIDRCLITCLKGE